MTGCFLDGWWRWMWPAPSTSSCPRSAARLDRWPRSPELDTTTPWRPSPQTLPRQNCRTDEEVSQLSVTGSFRKLCREVWKLKCSCLFLTGDRRNLLQSSPVYLEVTSLRRSKGREVTLRAPLSCLSSPSGLGYSASAPSPCGFVSVHSARCSAPLAVVVFFKPGSRGEGGREGGAQRIQGLMRVFCCLDRRDAVSFSFQE